MKLTLLFALVCLLPLMVSANVSRRRPMSQRHPKMPTTTDSGLASKVLEKGAGTVHPDAWDSVTVHYTGWTTDGKMFDSSVTRGEPATFPLNRVIPGWTEGVQLMVVGEKRRFWIPEELAYAGRPGAPQGMLVFDVELLEITEAADPPSTPADVAAPPKDAQVTDSGLASKVLEPGHRHRPPRCVGRGHRPLHRLDHRRQDVRLVGHPRPAGDLPPQPGDPRLDRGRPAHGRGREAAVLDPGGIAYAGRQGAPQGMLVFDVELVEIKDQVEPPKAPSDVAAPPADATTTDSGLASKVLEPGTGADHPKATNRVTVHYSGWTTDGKMFDSSVTRGQPATFALNQVIPGWTEGVQLMVVGEKRRFWIPEALAYKGQQGAPQGMLVFDVELLEIQ